MQSVTIYPKDKDRRRITILESATGEPIVRISWHDNTEQDLCDYTEQVVGPLIIRTYTHPDRENAVRLVEITLTGEGAEKSPY
jgi:hypothetical protein